MENTSENAPQTQNPYYHSDNVATPDDEPSKSNKNVLITLVVLLFILLAAGGSYLFFSYGNSQKTPNVNNPPLTQKLSPTTTLSNKENINAVTDDLSLSYFLTSSDKKFTVLKQVDFRTKKVKETRLENPGNDYVSYRFSPDEKYIVRISGKKLEIANLLDKNLTFTLVHTVPEVRDEGGKGPDYAGMGDAMWDGQSNLYFITSVGIDGVGAPPGGIYSDLYVANKDGSNLRLVNDHTKENQNYGFMKSFSYIDTNKKEIYLGGETHGGHIAPIQVINAENGGIVRKLGDLWSDYSNPVFNKDFSKAYFEKSLIYEEGYKPTHIYEYNMATKAKFFLYVVPNATQDDKSPQIEDNFGSLYLDRNNNQLYFQVADNKSVFFNLLDLETGQNKLLFTEVNGLFAENRGKDYCRRIGVSLTGGYLLFKCENDTDRDYVIHEVATGKRSVFYKDRKYVNENFSDPTLQLVSFR